MGSWSYSSPHGGVRSVGMDSWSYSSPHGGVRSVRVDSWSYSSPVCEECEKWGGG